MCSSDPVSVDGSIPIQALLYEDEELFSSQDGVGIYNGIQKSRDHQNGVVHATSHRIFYIDAQYSRAHSFALDLNFVVQTEYYAGLFKSSPKVTLHLSGRTVTSGISTPQSGFESWECEVCAFRNPPGLSPTAARVCGLCGVPRTVMPETTAPVSLAQQNLSTPLPSTVSPALSSSQDSVACSVCTFLNHPSLRSCEMCSTELPRVRRESLPPSRLPSPDLEDSDPSSPKSIKISFRKGGDKAFYSLLKRSLQSKAWEANGAASKSKIASNSIESDTALNGTTSGISGILKTVETSAQGRATHMQESLQDLEAFMIKAKDMVQLAAELNEKLTAASSSTSNASTLSHASPMSSSATLVASTEPEEATFIRSSLSQLGLQMTNTPVTLDMMKDERRWFEELAREFARVLQGSTPPKEGSGGMMRNRGMIALDEVWGGWNRARGVALIPPSTFLQVIPLLPSCTNPPIRLRTFPSGLNVLHTPPYTREAFAARLSRFLVMMGPKTTIQVALQENLTVSLVAEMIDIGESEGDVCRDDASAAISGGGSGTGGEVRWWPNLFLGYTWDGQI